MRVPSARQHLAAATLVVLTACAPPMAGEPAAPPSAGPSSDPSDSASETGSESASEAATDAPDDVTPQVTAIATGLAAPWDVAFTPDGGAYVTERDSGRLLRLDENGTPEPVQTVDVDDAGEGGLLGVAASPDFAADGMLYLYRSTTSSNELLRLQPGDDPEVLIDDIPHGAIHNAGRIAFGPDGMLYIGTGDAGDETTAQDLDSLAGKILRVAPDGAIPTDNPDPTSYVYAHGLRDPQGLTWDADGTMYASEFGPDRDDEVNVIVAGGDYGWPDVTGVADDDAFVDPIFVQQPPEASWSGIAHVHDSALPAWDGSLLVAALRGQRLWRVPTADPASTEELYVGEFGRLRHATQAPDGSIWVLTSNRDGRGQPTADDDRILRIAPAG
ncbi:PQQ-dependent sugar dehydrogenase [soil metagenome]